MLKPFRVRDLYDPTPVGEATPDQPAWSQCFDTPSDRAGIRKEGGSSSRRDGIVQVSSREYDEVIAKDPENKLSYVDDDDGETILVGSSLELTQRLDEPIWGLSPLNTSVLDRMHIFDIRNRSENALNTWKEFDTRTAAYHQPSAPVSCPNGSDYMEGPVASPPTSDPENHLSASNVEDPRQLWVKACNPPRPNEGTQANNTSQAKPDDEPVPDLEEAACNDSLKHPHSGNFSSSSLTEEGQRQAQAAGAKLRHSRSLFSEEKGSFVASSGENNFWSSYQASLSGSEANEKSQREPKSDESPIEVEQEQVPLLSVFEAELSKLMGQNVGSEPDISRDAEGTARPAPSSADPPTSEPPVQEPTQQAMPGTAEFVGQTLHTLLGGIGHLTSELRTRLPEVEQRLVNAQQHLPVQVEHTVQSSLNAMETHVQSLARAVQDAAASTRATAEKTREAEILASAQAEGLRGLATDLGNMGKTLFSAFEAGFIPKESQRENQRSSPDQEQTQSSEKNSSPAEATPNNAETPASCNESTRPQTCENCSTASQRTSEANKCSGICSAIPAVDTLFIGNLTLSTTSEAVRKYFADKGFLGRVDLPSGHAGFGYIHFPNKFAAAGAYHAAKGTSINGQSINLEFEKSPPSPQPASLPAAHTDTVSNTAPREPHSQRPTVTFEPSVGEASSSHNLRRAKSLGMMEGRRRMNSMPRAREHGANPELQQPGDTNAGKSQDDESSRKAGHRDHSLLDQEDSNREFSSRYPSLLALETSDSVPSNRFSYWDPVRQPEGQRPAQPGRRRHAQQPKESSTLQLSPPIAAQNTSIPSFPPIPREMSPPAVPDKLPGAWPREQNSVHGGAPIGGFNAMDSLRRSNTTLTSNPAARLTSPFNPLSDRSPQFPGPIPRRSATERRPHRVAHTTYANHWLTPRGDRHHGHVEREASPFQNYDSTPGSFPIEAHQNQSPSSEMTDPSGIIGLCLKHLVALGYAADTSRDASRLRVYAEAANGNLEEAIEMIEEERKAYEQQPSLI